MGQIDKAAAEQSQCSNSLEALTWNKVSGCCIKTEMAAEYEHIVAAIRHSERMDAEHVVRRTVKAGPPPGRELDWPWNSRAQEPFDHWNPPLSSPEGFELARQQAHNLLKAMQQQSQKIRSRPLDMDRVVVVCSPFHRCIQTAIEVCKVFGVKMIIDTDICEVYDYRGMGTRRAPTLPTYEQLLKDFPEAPIVQDGPMGETPTFEESVSDYRFRFARGLQRWLDRGAQVQMDVILCTHGDFFPVCFEMIRPEAWFNAEYDIGYSSFMIVSRTAQLRLRPKDLKKAKGTEDPEVLPVVAGDTWRSKDLEVVIPESSPFKFKFAIDMAPGQQRQLGAAGSQGEYEAMVEDVACREKKAQKNAPDREEDIRVMQRALSLIRKSGRKQLNANVSEYTAVVSFIEPIVKAPVQGWDDQSDFQSIVPSPTAEGVKDKGSLPGELLEVEDL